MKATTFCLVCHGPMEVHGSPENMVFKKPCDCNLKEFREAFPEDFNSFIFLFKLMHFLG